MVFLVGIRLKIHHCRLPRDLVAFNAFMPCLLGSVYLIYDNISQGYD